MEAGTGSLNGLLRWELSAVHQQFIHVLALRRWGDRATAARIMEVDEVDFPNAMAIADHLVERGQPIALPAAEFSPGGGLESILAAEQAMEARLTAAIDGVACEDARSRALVATAREPRRAYADWLAQSPTGSAAARTAPDESRAPLSYLTAMIDQTVVHAFVHWRKGAPAAADGTWATCGAAMMHGTALVEVLADRQAAPRLGTPVAPAISSDPAGALAEDRALAGRMAEVATAAAHASRDDRLAPLWQDMAETYGQLADWQPGAAHPAVKRIPPAFHSFAATLERYLPAAAAGERPGR